MTTRERIVTLADDGHEQHIIAALLGLDVVDVAKALAEPGYTPPNPGLSPTTRTLGPYTIGPAEGFTPTVDLGADSLGAIREYAIVVTASNLDGGRAMNIDFAAEEETSLDRPGYAGVQPAGFAPEALESLPVTASGNIWVPRFFRFHHEIEEAGEAASATFHVDLTYF